jgi:SSS family solute:Na+ symporter
MIHVRQAALDFWWKLAGILSGGVLGLFLLGMLSRRAQSIHAAIGVVSGVIVIAWMTFTPLWGKDLREAGLGWFVSPFHDNLIIVAGTGTILVVGLACSRFSKRQFRVIDPVLDRNAIGNGELLSQPE